MRILPADLKTFWDNRILHMEEFAPVSLLLAAAATCIGTHEEGGNNRGPMVELFQSVVGKPVGQPWCLDFAQACIAYVEATFKIQSKLPATQLCLGLWHAASDSSKVSPPLPGDLIVWQHGETMEGHVGIVTGIDDHFYRTIEGNTSDSQEINREGDGVYFKYRQKGGSKTLKEVGFLRCFDAS